MPTDKMTADRARQLLGEGHREREEDILIRERLKRFGQRDPEPLADEKPAKAKKTTAPSA